MRNIILAILATVAIAGTALATDPEIDWQQRALDAQLRAIDAETAYLQERAVNLQRARTDVQAQIAGA